MNKVTTHLKTVLRHKKEVFLLMNHFDMPLQGLLHDMSKFSPVEFMESIKYANGKRSPVEISREVNGYSKAWLHHKGRNKHHWKYWVGKYFDGGVGCIMPYRYAVEIVVADMEDINVEKLKVVLSESKEIGDKLLVMNEN